MTAGRKIIVNCASILTGNFLNKAISIAVLMCLTRYLSPAEFGRYSFVIAYTSFFGVFTELGINTLMTRDISAGTIDAGYGLGHAILLRAGLTIATAAASLASLLVMGYPFDLVLLAAASSISLFISFRGLFLRTVFDIPFQVNLKMAYPSLINFLNEVVTLGVLLWLVREKAGLLTLVLSINLANLPGFICILALSVRQVRPRFKLDTKAWWKILSEALPLGAASFLEGVFIITPVFILSRFSTEEALGYYSLPFRLVSSLWIVPVAVMITLLPRMSRDALKSVLTVKDGFTRGLKLVLVTGLPLGLATGCFSEKVINIFTHGRYTGSVPVLSFMIWGTVLYFINTVFLYSFTAAGRQRINTIVWSFTSASSAVLCLILIPRYHHMGAAAGFVLSLGAGLAANIFFAYRTLGINPFPVFSRFIPGAALVALALFFMPGIPGLIFPVTLASYAAAVVSMKAVSVREWGEWLKRGAEPGCSRLKTVKEKSD